MSEYERARRIWIPSVTRVMGLALLALLPGALAQIWQLGAGFAGQLLLAVTFALGFEALMLTFRGRPLRPFLSDLSAPLAALLLALLLPPSTPWWMLALGLFAAVVIGKHLFGGLGENLFNPAMVGYAALLAGFPAHFDPALGGAASAASIPMWIGGLYALGGIFLIARKIIAWQTPLAMLSAFTVANFALRIVADNAAIGASGQVVPGAILLAAFFIVTDPVTGCLSPRGRVCVGAGVGLLSALLNQALPFPLGLPFAVLAMNMAAPWLDKHTRPARPVATAQP
jgi:electron transport complex protein RnfD